jgi:peroxiredoxin
MVSRRRFGLTMIATLLLAQGAISTRPAVAQDAAKAQRATLKPQGKESVKSINDDFDRAVTALEKARLVRLERLAASQPKGEAEATYELLFQAAIATSLFREAEPAAERVIKEGTSSARVNLLAELVNIMGEADRGAFEESLKSLTTAFDAADGGNQGATLRKVLPLTAKLSLLEAYYQRLVQGDQFEVARKAFQFIQERTKDAAVKDFTAQRLARLALAGKPAPAIEGKDVDDKMIRLSDQKGDVVLVVFWATWCLPNAEEIAWFRKLYDEYRGRGFRVLGINLDTLQDGGKSPEAVLPEVRRYLVDHNVSWPNLINGAGGHDYAKAFGVAEIPANFLVGRDGTIVHFDLTASNFEKVVSRALGR